MFKNILVESWPSRLDDGPAESDDDAISLTSTIPPPDDEEYVVESILAERPNQNGIMYYLVQWDATRFDPFWDSTWEPAEIFGDDMIAQWAETKAKQEAGEEKPFDVDRYFAVQQQKEREKRERHNLRNAKRARLGLPLTEPLPASSSKSSAIPEDDSSSDEASEDGDVVEVSAPRPKPPKARKPSLTSIYKKGVARPIKTTAPKSPTKSKPLKSSALSKPNKDRPASLPGKLAKPAATSDPLASSSTKKRQATAPSTTGYEGTARKASKDDMSGPSKSKTKESNLGSKGAASSKRAPSGQKTTARKSTQKTVQSKTGNIFTGGKVRKPRPVIEEVMSNPAKDPKPFSNMHLGRLAELRSRAREDIAPDPSKVALFPLTEGPAAARKMSKETAQPTDLPEDDSLFVGDYSMELESDPEDITAPISSSRTGLAPISTGLVPATSAGLTATSAGISPRTIDPAPASAGLPPPSACLPSSPQAHTAPISRPPLKKRKSVRWDDDVNSVIEFREPDPMDLDDNTLVQKDQVEATPRPAASLAARPPTPPPTLSAPEPTVTIIPQRNTCSEKRVRFGKPQPGSKCIQTTFNGLPDGTRDELYARFLATESLEFDHSCLATSVATALHSMVKTGLAFGGLSSNTDQQRLQNVASSLRASIMGLLCAQPDFSILIYPSKCEEWNAVQLRGLPASDPSEFELLYYIFTPHEPLLALLPPPRDVPPKPPGAGKESSNRQLIMEKFFGFDYQRLLPTSLKPASTHNFFLAFPDSKVEVRLLLFHWLRACEPNCCIFTSDHPGSWYAFQNKLSSEETAGVVIVHELMAWTLHRLPNLRHLLLSRDDQFWCFTEPMSKLPMYPSTTSLLEESSVVPPGQLQLTRLFPLGAAILLTPSFLVAEPTRALEIIDWFLMYFAKSTTCRLVTAWDFAAYLRDLAEEKEHDRAKLLASPAAMESTANLAILENLKGLSKEDCESRFTAATKAYELDDLRRRKLPPVGDNEESATLVYAIDKIDPNDEKSLVNWFGYWSTLRLDQFRHFYVLGTDDSITARRSERGEREIAVPRYTSRTINDSDYVLKGTLEHYRVCNTQAEQSGQAHAVAESAGIAPAATSAAAPASVYQAFAMHEVSSECFSRISQHSLAEMLKDVGPSEWNSSLWILFGFPVSWSDSDMGDHYEDFTLHWNTISSWFKWGFPWGGRHGTTRFNTYVGFFYTIPDEWDPDNKPDDRTPKRHPWLVFYRPRDAFKRPWTDAELIIWDPAAPRRFGDRQPTEGELTFMQRQLIKHVREHTGERNPGTRLTDVWLGGYMVPEECQSPHDIDVVALFLQALGTEFQFKKLIPAPRTSMLRPNKGFKRVKLATDPATDEDDVEMGIRDSETSDEEDARIIFHPPRATGRPLSDDGAPSKCTNRLFEEARLWRNRYGRRSQYMKYRFRPTTEWYKDQEEEGRGFSHITVDSWRNIFGALSIGQHKGSTVGSA